VKIPAIEVAAGGSLQLEVIATDQHGNSVSDANVAWRVIEKDVGSITQTGLFTAGEIVRTFNNAIEVHVSKGELVRTATALVTITSGPLEQVIIAPNPAEIGMEMTQQFVAVGADLYGNRISGLTFNWSVENDGGTIDGTGLFTAGSIPGIYENTVKVEATQESATRFATASVTVEPDRIVFVSGPTTKSLDIYIMDADSSNVKQLTDTAVTEGDFSCSPDGRSIVYDSGGSKSKIMVMNIDNRQELCLSGDDTETSNHNPTWSPDGTRIVFSSHNLTEKNSDIYVVDADGKNLTKLTDTSKCNETDPDWSPDGTQIVFSSYNITEGESNIYVMDSDGSNLTQLTNTIERSEGLPVWFPDGTRIMFSEHSLIYVMNADGSNQKRLVSLPVSSPKLLPDGTKIIFSAIATKDTGIFVINPDGTNRRILISQRGRDYSEPAWSPDGSKIVFLSAEVFYAVVSWRSWGTRSPTEIYVMDADGSHPIQVTDSKEMKMYPQWVPRKGSVEVTEDSVVIPGAGTSKK
jgi:TolB protein